MHALSSACTVYDIRERSLLRASLPAQKPGGAVTKPAGTESTAAKNAAKFHVFIYRDSTEPEAGANAG